MPDAWDPTRYRRFGAERRQPFDDLLAMVDPVPGGRVVDLGCGSGELTAELHTATGAAQTVGVDSSEAMLAEVRGHAPAGSGLSFVAADITAFVDRVDSGGGQGESGFDIVFSNAALQWVDDHRGLLPRLARAVAPGGQLAFQVPANFDHPSHVVGRELAATEPWASSLAAADVADRVVPVLAPEEYAEELNDLGFADQRVWLQVYGHHLSSVDEVTEWVRGTFLTWYEAALPAEEYEAFLDAYRRELRRRLGERAPYFYAFKRILVWGRRAP